LAGGVLADTRGVCVFRCLPYERERAFDPLPKVRRNCAGMAERGGRVRRGPWRRIRVVIRYRGLVMAGSDVACVVRASDVSIAGRSRHQLIADVPTRSGIRCADKVRRFGLWLHVCHRWRLVTRGREPPHKEVTNSLRFRRRIGYYRRRRSTEVIRHCRFIR
jgi:hypothetical protein